MAALSEAIEAFKAEQDLRPVYERIERIDLCFSCRQLLKEYVLEKGRTLLSGLQERLERTEAVDLGYGSKMEKFRSYDLEFPRMNPFGRPELEAAKADVRGMQSVSHGVLEPRDLKVIQTMAHNQELNGAFTSELAIDAEAGVLIAMQNFAFRDTSVVSNKLRNSDLLFFQWKRMAERQRASVRGLKQVWRYCIVNPVTIAVIEQCLRIGRTAGPITFERGSDELACLVGTPNGRGVVFLLQDFCKALGFKDIVSVTL